MRKQAIISTTAACLAMQSGIAQDWNRLPGGDVITTSEWIGADVNSLIPFHLRTIPNLSIDFSTSNLLRMRLNPTQNTTINTFTVPTDGFLGLGPNGTAGNTAPISPWTRLHLHDNVTTGAAVQNGFRNWMRNGVTMTGHGDQMYVGHKYGPALADPTDAIFQWSDNGGALNGPDLMRFVFTASYNPLATSGQNSLFGRERMQLHPLGMVGIGDWNAAAESPTERLDILDGRVRIRQLPDDDEAPELDKVLVVDDLDPNDPEYGVIKWRSATGIGGGCSSGWNLVGLNPCTAYNGNPCVPQDPENVGYWHTSAQCKIARAEDDIRRIGQ